MSILCRPTTSRHIQVWRKDLATYHLLPVISVSSITPTCIYHTKKVGVEYVNTCMKELFLMFYHRVEQYRRVGRTHNPRKSHPGYNYICIRASSVNSG